MDNPGTFDKCRKQIDGAIKRRQKIGAEFAAMNLPYLTSQDKISTDDYLKELEHRGLTVNITHTDSSLYGWVSW